MKTMIDKVTFTKAMNCIKAQMEANDIKAQKLMDIFGDTEEIQNMFDVYPWVQLLEEVCGDTTNLISAYIYESDWGNYEMKLTDKTTAIIYSFKTIDDVYEVLNHGQPWNFVW